MVETVVRSAGNCHALDSGARDILSFVHIGATFPQEKLKAIGFVEIESGTSLASLKKTLQPGDIVCCLDELDKIGFHETHTGIVIGTNDNHNIIIRQKLNEISPVVDMTAEHFDKIELSNSNMLVKVYRNPNLPKL